MGSQDLQTARYDQLVRRLGALYGGGSKVVEVLPELFPVIDVESLPPEALAFTGWRTAWQNIDQAAVAAVTSAVQLSNPVGSGIIAAVTQVNMRSDVANSMQMLLTDILFVSPAIRGLFRDGRFAPGRQTALELRNDPAIATGAGIRIRGNIDEVITFRDDNGIVVLTPGTALQIGTTSNLTNLSTNFWWRERTAEPSELNFP